MEIIVLNVILKRIAKFSALSIFVICFGVQNLFAGEYPKTEPNDPRKVRSSTSPEWLQAVGRSIMVISVDDDGKKHREACSWSLIVDKPTKDGVIVVGAGHCIAHMASSSTESGFAVTENKITWTTQSGQKITRQIVYILEASMASGDYAIAKLDRPISRRDIKPLVNAPFDYTDLLDEELFFSNGEPFKPFGTVAGYSADAGLGQKGKVLTYDDSDSCILTGGASAQKSSYCYSYEGASGGPVAVTLYLSGDTEGNAGGLWVLAWDDYPNVKPGPYTFWVGSIVGRSVFDGYDRTRWTPSIHYTKKLDEILQAN